MHGKEEDGCEKEGGKDERCKTEEHIKREEAEWKEGAGIDIVVGVNTYRSPPVSPALVTPSLIHRNNLFESL